MRLTSMVFIMLLGTAVILCSILIRIRKVMRQKGLRQKKLSFGKKLKDGVVCIQQKTQKAIFQK